MLVFNRRPHETIISAAFQAPVQAAPEAPLPVEVCVQTGPSAGDTPGLMKLDRLVQTRLDVARLGLTELRRRIRIDGGDAETILNKIDEDLHLLQGRLRREAEQRAPRSIPVRRDEVHGGPRKPR